MKRIPHQLIELNSTFIWHWPWFIQGVECAKQHGFTGIILHQQELFSILATPSPLSQRVNVENLIHQQHYALHYLKRVDRYLQENNLSFWLQGEAAPTDDIIRRKFPEFAFDENSTPDFWSHFYATIFTPLLTALPHLSGVILSLTTPTFQAESWQQALHHAWSLLRRHGKKLVLRDFIDESWPRQQLTGVLSALPADVRASIKATELDYHPGFANHPAIATLTGHKKWIEYDLFGIGYGWTLLPCYLADDIRGRLSWAISVAGDDIEAITSRISWQWLPDSRVMDSVNDINLPGLRVANQRTPDSVFELWSEQHQLRFRTSQDRQRLAEVLQASYDWLCKTPNMLGRRLHYQSQIPASIAQAQQLLHMDTRSANWLQAWQPLMPVDDMALGLEQRQLIRLEKENACFLAARAVQSLRELLPRIACPNDTLERLLNAWRSAEIYSQMFAQVADAIADELWCDHYGDASLPADTLRQHQERLLRYADTLDRWLEPSTAPPFLPLLISPQRLRGFACSLAKSE
ncbi:hypothetical protein [Superficieibacter sp.]|uniref:hypothetical protein n=1 Tax=Superficieibacter sp. TaxID=2303322 RepID=UPI0028A87315|nr:hypothetical protein [Superficieibacter sp.]